METHTKIIAIYNTFDGEELLTGSIKCLREHVDFVLVVAQKVSNYGEKYEDGFNLAKSLKTVDHVIEYIPDLKIPASKRGTINETRKRNMGIEYAKQKGFDTFILCDNDEYFEDFGKAKKEFIDSGADGSYCSMFTYFKLPTLRFENKDSYFVPFLHKLFPDTSTGSGAYPVLVDPTRRINITNAILIDEPMLHYSWCRKNIMMKVRNSSAQANIANSNRLKDYNNPDCKEGFYCKDYDQKLILVPNTFGIEFK